MFAALQHTLPAPIDDLADWLADYLRSRIYDAKFPGDNGLFVLNLVHEKPAYGGRHTVISLSGGYLIDSEKPEYHLLPDMAEYKLQRLGVERTLVTVNYMVNSMVPFLQQALSEAKELWPGSEPVSMLEEAKPEKEPGLHGGTIRPTEKAEGNYCPEFIKDAIKALIEDSEIRLTVQALSSKLGMERANLYKTYGINKQRLRQLAKEIQAID